MQRLCRVIEGMKRFVFPLVLLALSASAAPHDKALAFLETLTEKQRTSASHDYDDPSRTDWHYIPKEVRKGALLRDMTAGQRDAGMALLASSLSPEGYRKATTVMQLEGVLRLLENNPERRDPTKYYISIFGTPADNGTWGYSFEGHHLSLNFVYEEGRLVCATPMFLGGNPDEVIKSAEGLPPVGHRVLQAEQDIGLALAKALSSKAVNLGKPDRDMKEGGKTQAQERRRIGVAGKDMNEDQIEILWALIDTYLGYVPADYAERLRAGIKGAGADTITFGWHGSDDLDKPHRYQVVGDTFSIVYYNTQGDSLKTPANHSHAILRTIGGDFYISE